MAKYVTIADLREYAAVTANDEDSLLSDIIDQAQKIIENQVGFIFDASTDTDRTFDAVDDVEGDTLWLDQWLLSVNSITNGDGTTVTSSQYVTEPRNDGPFYAIKIRSDASIGWVAGSYHENAITVNGEWGYSASAPDDVKWAVLRLAKFLYQGRDHAADLDRPLLTGDGLTIMPGRIPSDVQRVIDFYRSKTPWQ